MAGDWIKMRVDLYRDPKISLIADSLMSEDGDLALAITQTLGGRDVTVTRNVIRNAAVGALVSIWGVLRHRGKRNGDDLDVSGVGPSVVDDIADLPGIGLALVDCGWLIETENGIKLPNFFEELNVDPSLDFSKKNAERQRRFRERKKAKDSNVTCNVTVTSQSNIEKRRESSLLGENLVSTHSEPVGTEVDAALQHHGQSAGARNGKHTKNGSTDFDAWWSVYPRKESKGTAEKAYAKSVVMIMQVLDSTKEFAVNWLLEKTKEYADSRIGKDRTYTPHPATWLNGKKYDDDPAEWKRPDSVGNTRSRTGIQIGAGQRYDPAAEVTGL